MDDAAVQAGEGVTRGFLFADLRGYTQMVEAQGAVEARHALERYRTLTRQVVGRHGGAEIRTEGDSFYVVLPSASAAVRCGLDLVAAALSPPDGEGPIAVGVGVHAGEAVPFSGDYVGSAVNIAARICAKAGANELLASGTVRELSRSMVSARFMPTGRRALKGITGPVELFRVEADDGTVLPSRRLSVGRLAPHVRWPWVAAGASLVVGAVAIGVVVWAQTPGTSGLSVGPRTSDSQATSALRLPARDAGSQAPPPALAPGTYIVGLNRDVARITIDEDGWSLLADQADVLALELGPPQLVPGSLGVSRIPVVFNGGCPNDPALLLGDQPDDLIAWASSNPHLEASAPRVALRLGLQGVAVNATVLPLPDDACPGGNPERIRLWQQGGLDVALIPGSRLTLEALGVANATLVIAVISEDPGAFSGFAIHAERLLTRMVLRP